jgi:circadian clock protein KaiC
MTRAYPLATREKSDTQRLSPLEKAPTGIKGLDQITLGGFPKGRTTIVCGGPGCGKTMLGLEFLVRGAVQFDEPGVLMAFEETPQDMAQNVASLGFDIEDLASRKKLFLDYVYIEPSEIQETGEYDLEGLFIRLQHAVDTVGAKRVMLDTLEALFSGFAKPGILRAEIRRLFRWLKERQLTTVVTAEKGEGTLTRYGLEEYVSDCVIVLDHRIEEQISTRRMRIVKYRGTSHGADEYPFLIDDQGLSVLPITSLELQHKASSERVSSGVPDLDAMLEGQGFYRGSSTLVSGTSGSGKTTLGISFAEASCLRGERSLYVGFEESAGQVTRNAKSVGIDLEPHLRSGLLSYNAWRPTQYGMEMHLLRIHKLVEKVNPDTVVVDPISNLVSTGARKEVHSMMIRLLDMLKERQITALFTNLTQPGGSLEKSEVGISSLMDTWILLRDVELNGERNRCIYVLKSRGMAHSNQVREFLLTSQGIRLLPAYVGSGGVLTGSSRVAQEAQDQAAAVAQDLEAERRRQELVRKRAVIEAQMKALQAQLDVEENRLRQELREDGERGRREQTVRDTLVRMRHAEVSEPTEPGKNPVGGDA